MPPGTPPPGESGTTALPAVRAAVPADVPLLALHRVRMFQAMGRMEPGADADRAVLGGTERFIAAAMARGEWHGWIAVDGDAVLGSGCAMLRALPPGPVAPEGGLEAYLLSVFTEPAARRRGAATAVVRACLDWGRERGVGRFALHASAEGRPVYEPLGFRPRGGEMVLVPGRAAAAPRHRLTDRVLRDEGALRALLGEPADLVRAKVAARLTPLTRRFIEASPFVALATSGADGSCDVSPRGDPAGFVRILDDATLLLPERPGNRLADSLRNILANPRVALLFLIPGAPDSFRVDGRAAITDDPVLLAPSTVEGRAPRLGILVDVEHAYTQCGKAVLRSRLWDPALFLDPASLPTGGEIHGERCGPSFDVAAHDAARRKRYEGREGFY